MVVEAFLALRLVKMLEEVVISLQRVASGLVNMADEAKFRSPTCSTFAALFS